MTKRHPCRFEFPVSAAEPNARLVIDTLSGKQVAGTVFRSTVSGQFHYQRGVWNGQKQVFDTLSADTLDELSVLIDDYLEPS